MCMIIDFYLDHMPRSFFRPKKTKKYNYCIGFKKLIFTDGMFDNDLYTTGVLFEFDSNKVIIIVNFDRIIFNLYIAIITYYTNQIENTNLKMFGINV